MSVTEKLLFVDTFLLGDLLYLGALINAIRVQRPDVQIEVLASTVTRGFPFFERLNVTVHHYDFPWSHVGWHLHPVRMLQALVVFKRRFRRQFREHTILSPREDLRHMLTARLLQPRRFIQYHSGADWRDAWRGRPPRHPFVNSQEFLRQITGECGFLPEANIPWPWLVDFRTGQPSDTLRDVLLAPEASNRLKYWKSEYWQLLSASLQQSGFKVKLVVHRGDAIPNAKKGEFDDIWQGSIIELARLIGKARAVIAVDSFVGHLAAAIGTPVVTLFGPGSPEHWRPWGERTAIVMAEGFTCRPCGHKRCVQMYRNCMDAIQVEKVMQAFKSRAIIT